MTLDMNEEDMNNSSMNLTITQASSDPVTHFIGLMGPLHICFLTINILFGLPTHSFVIFLIVRGRENGIASEFFNLNLSVCEIGVCLNWFVDILTLWFSSLTEFAYFLKGLAITGCPLFQCLICVERYLAVVHPVTFLKYKPLRYRVICCSAAWIICFGSCLNCIFILVLYTFEVFTWFMSVEFLVFLSIKLFCCVAVLRALKQSGPGERGREREEKNHMKRKAFNIILITTVTTVFIYIPSTLSGFFTVMTQQYVQETFLISFSCFVLAGFVQPVLYLHRAGKLHCLSS